MKTIQAEKRSKAEIAMTRFWKRKDVMVVAAGSIPCIRESYILAKEMGTLHQFRYVSLTNSDYILGNAEDIIREALRKAALVPGVQVVVFYLSCLDILVRLDFHNLEENLYKETGVLVKCFYAWMRIPLCVLFLKKPVQSFNYQANYRHQYLMEPEFLIGCGVIDGRMYWLHQQGVAAA